MKSFATRIFAIVLAVAGIFISLSISDSSQAAPSRQTLSLRGGNTDASHAVGSQDPYTESSTDNGVTWNPAYLVGGSHPWGLVSGTNSWINCGPSLSDCLNATSLYRYRFWVPADFANPTISGSMIMDNFGSVFLNSQSLVSNAPGNYTFPANTDVTGKLVAGWNEIRVQLVDVGGLTGINFNLVIAIDSESEMSLASPGKLVIYDAQSGTGSRLNDSVTGSNSIDSFPTATRSGYEFLGWYTAASGGTLVSTPYMPAGDVTLYAQWDQLHEVIYDEQGGSPVSDSVYREGGTVTLPAAPTKAGYNFDGWYDSALNGNRYGTTFSPSGTGTVYVYAHWSLSPASSGSYRPPTRTIAFRGNGSSGQTQFQVGTSTSILPANPFIRPGFVFVGWNSAEDGSGLRYQPGTQFSEVKGEELFAEWKVAPIKKLVSQFKGNSSKLKKLMSITISRFVAKIPNDAVVTCTGSTSGRFVTTFDRRLATNRAINVCKKAQSLSSSLTYKIAITPSSSVKSSARHVWIEYK